MPKHQFKARGFFDAINTGKQAIQRPASPMVAYIAGQRKRSEKTPVAAAGSSKLAKKPNPEKQISMKPNAEAKNAGLRIAIPANTAAARIINKPATIRLHLGFLPTVASSYAKPMFLRCLLALADYECR